MTLEQPSKAPRRYIPHGSYPKQQFGKLDKIWITCPATKDAAADRKTLHELSRAYRDVEMFIHRHNTDKEDYTSEFQDYINEVYGLAMAMAKFFGIACIRYEAWMHIITSEFVHSGVWFGLP